MLIRTSKGQVECTIEEWPLASLLTLSVMKKWTLKSRLLSHNDIVVSDKERVRKPDGRIYERERE